MLVETGEMAGLTLGSSPQELSQRVVGDPSCAPLESLDGLYSILFVFVRAIPNPRT